MPYVITEKWLGERYATCVSVCPVDCIKPIDYQGQEFMVILPDVCVDCGLCEPECPISAIIKDAEEDPTWAQINADLSPAASQNPAVTPRAATDPPRKPTNVLRSA